MVGAPSRAPPSSCRPSRRRWPRPPHCSASASCSSPFSDKGADPAETSQIAEQATSDFQYAVRRPPLTEHAETDPDAVKLDVIGAARVDKGVAVTGEVTAPLNSLRGVAAVLTWVRSLIPREEIRRSAASPPSCAGARRGKAEDIASCVRQEFGRDKQARFEACEVVDRPLPALAEHVLRHAKDDLRAALSDPRLRSWAPHDPALQVRTLAGDDEWQALLGRETMLAGV